MLAGAAGKATIRDVPAQGYEQRAGWGFPLLTLTTVISILGLVTLGGVVRLTESGLGCPDWPLCHGKLLPSLDKPTLIEYSHRLLATVVGLLVLATTVVVWRYRRRETWLLVPATLGFILLVVQVLLGGVTVRSELASEVVVAHLATAEGLMACMVVVALVAFRGDPDPQPSHRARPGRDFLPLLVLAVAVTTYALLLVGSYVTHSGGTVSCGQSWPLCQGSLLPEGHHAVMNMLHRLVALLAGILVVVVVVMAWRRGSEWRALGWTSAAVTGLFIAQVLVGASVLWMGFAMEARVLHLSMGTLTWAGLIVLAVVAYRGPRIKDRGAGVA